MNIIDGNTVLTSSSVYIPEVGECEKCKYVKQCKGGELCKMGYDTWVVKRGKARARKDERKQREHLSNVL